MSNDSQLKAVFAPFLKAHPEARYHNGRIFLRPLSQVAWALALRTSRSPDSFSVTWGASEMFIPDAPVWPLDHSLFPEGGCALSHEGIAEALWRATEEQCLAHIPAKPTLADLYHLGVNRNDPSRPNFYDVSRTFGSFYHAAQGNIENALQLSTELVTATMQSPIERMDLTVRMVIRDLYPLLLAGDRRGIGALLRQIEQRCVVSHKMEKFWEPAPYPVELQS